MNWPTRADRAATLKAEARAIAERLGHSLWEWVEAGMDIRSRCHTCYQSAHLRPRRFGAAPMSGEALSLPCSKPAPRKPTPQPAAPVKINGKWRYTPNP